MALTCWFASRTMMMMESPWYSQKVRSGIRVIYCILPDYLNTRYLFLSFPSFPSRSLGLSAYMGAAERLHYYSRDCCLLLVLWCSGGKEDWKVMRSPAALPESK